MANAKSFRGDRPSFRLGMVNRLAERLAELIEASRPKGGSTGSALVPLKHALVTEEFKKLGLRMTSHTARTFVAADPRAYAAGQSAGSRVDLGGGKLGSGQRRIGSA